MLLEASTPRIQNAETARRNAQPDIERQHKQQQDEHQMRLAAATSRSTNPTKDAIPTADI